MIAILGLTVACSGSENAGASAAASAAPPSSAAALPSSAVSASAAAAASSSAAAASAAAAARGSAAAAMASAAQSAAQSAQAQASGAAARATTGNPQAQAVGHAAALEAARENADLDAPGDDNGAPCATDPQYRDEQPIGLQPDVTTAWQTAVSQAAAAGVTLCLNDGKRSRGQQQATYDQYVTQFGKAMADEYVLSPEKSAHVLGLAIDVQPLAGHNWLEGTAGAFGFCRTYDNEAWHFEYDAAFVSGGCPTRTAHPGG